MRIVSLDVENTLTQKTAPLAPSGASAAAPERALKKSEHPFPPLEAFTFSLYGSKSGWYGPGGSAVEQNVSNFPLSTSFASVSMKLDPGAMRELHWHAIAGEWAYVLTGHMRTTVITPKGAAQENEFGPGDTWFFPKGHGHALQNIGKEECHFIIGFDNGHFSEFGTFSISDWVGNTPVDIAARTLGLPQSVVAALPKGEVYITPGKPPAQAAQDEALRSGNRLQNQVEHMFRLADFAPVEFPGGEERIVTVKEFPVQDTISSGRINMQPGALRELHWHPNADEWQFYVKGRARVGIFGAHGRVEVAEVGPGDVAFIPMGFGHWIEQIGSDPTELLLLFSNPNYQEISLSTWLAGNPMSVLRDNFGITEDQVAQLPSKNQGILR
jgi:oxalate decarboxylase